MVIVQKYKNFESFFVTLRLYIEENFKGEIIMSKSKKIITSLIITIMTVFTLVGCGQEPLPEANGYQWEVTKEGKKMYIMGTIHLTDPRYDYMTEDIKKILDESDGLAVEIDLTSEEVTNLANELSMYKDGKNIESELKVEEIEKLKLLSEDMGINYEVIKGIRPTSICSNIGLFGYIKSGINGEAVDSKVANYMKKNNKEVIELENVEDQNNVLNKISGINKLKEFLTEYEKGDIQNNSNIEEAQKVSSAYIESNEKYLEDLCKEMLEQDLNEYNLMLKDRNIKMVEKIEKMFKDDKTYTVAVGSMHYFGEDGIVKLLESKGYAVKKLFLVR